MPTPEPQTQAMNIEPNVVLAQTSGCLAAEMGEEMVIMSAARGVYFSLDPIGKDVWLRLASPCTFAALCDELTKTYDAPRTTIEADVSTLLGILLDAGAVELQR